MKLKTVYEYFPAGDWENAIDDTESRDEAVRLFNEGYNIMEHHIHRFQITTHTRKSITYSEQWQH